MKINDENKIVYDSLDECLFILNAIRFSIDPVPECVVDTIRLVEQIRKDI